MPLHVIQATVHSNIGTFAGFLDYTLVIVILLSQREGPINFVFIELSIQIFSILAPFITELWQHCIVNKSL